MWPVWRVINFFLLLALSQCLDLMESTPEIMRAHPMTTPAAATSRSWYAALISPTEYLCLWRQPINLRLRPELGISHVCNKGYMLPYGKALVDKPYDSLMIWLHGIIPNSEICLSPCQFPPLPEYWDERVLGLLPKKEQLHRRLDVVSDWRFEYRDPGCFFLRNKDSWFWIKRELRLRRANAGRRSSDWSIPQPTSNQFSVTIHKPRTTLIMLQTGYYTRAGYITDMHVYEKGGQRKGNETKTALSPSIRTGVLWRWYRLAICISGNGLWIPGFGECFFVWYLEFGEFGRFAHLQ